MTTIYLLRHAAYENPRKIFHGRLPGFPLSPKGREMARQLARHLAKKPVVAVYASSLVRAYETAAIVAKIHGLTVYTDERLLDIRSPLQGKPLDYIERIGSNFYQRALILAGGERLREIYARIDRCLREIARKHAGGHVVVVSHGDPIMTIAAKYSGMRLPKKFLYDERYVPMAAGFAIHFDGHGSPRKISTFPTR